MAKHDIIGRPYAVLFFNLTATVRTVKTNMFKMNHNNNIFHLN